MPPARKKDSVAKKTAPTTRAKATRTAVVEIEDDDELEVVQVVKQKASVPKSSRQKTDATAKKVPAKAPAKSAKKDAEPKKTSASKRGKKAVEEEEEVEEEDEEDVEEISLEVEPEDLDASDSDDEDEEDDEDILKKKPTKRQSKKKPAVAEKETTTTTAKKGQKKNKQQTEDADEETTAEAAPVEKLSRKEEDKLIIDTHDLSMVLDRAQKSLAHHRSCMALCLQLHENDGPKFTADFMRLVLPVLIVQRREAAVERVIQFLVLYATSTPHKALFPMEQDFCTFFLEFCLSIANSHQNAVRFRATQLVSGCLKSLPEDFVLDEELYQNMLESMRQRAYDKVVATRVLALSALVRLQDPNAVEEDEEDNTTTTACPVIKIMLDRLQNDSAKQVRRQALESIVICPQTIGPILARSRDKAHEVRVHCFEILQSRIEFRMLSVSQRVQLLTAGLRDREETVRAACISMLKSWFSSKSHDMVSLLSGLDVANNETVAQDVVLQLLPMMLKNIHSSVEYATASDVKKLLEGSFNLSQTLQLVTKALSSSNSKKANNNSSQENEEGGEDDDLLDRSIPEDDGPEEDDPIELMISAEQALVWRVVAQFFRRNVEVLDEILPSSSADFYRLFQSVQMANTFGALTSPSDLRSSQIDQDLELEERFATSKDFVARQLLLIAQWMDRSDEGGRRMMQQLYRETLSSPNAPHTIVPLLIDRLRELQTDSVAFGRMIVELVAESSEALQIIISPECQEKINETRLAIQKHEEELKKIQNKIERLRQQQPQTKEIKTQISRLMESARKVEDALAPLDEQADMSTQLEHYSYLRCMKIAEGLLHMLPVAGTRHPSVAHLSGLLSIGGVAEWESLFFIPASRHSNVEIKTHAIHSLGLLSLHDLTKAQTYTPLFFSTLTDSQLSPTVRIKALMVLIDCICVHGLDLIESQLRSHQEEEAKNKTSTKTQRNRRLSQLRSKQRLWLLGSKASQEDDEDADESSSLDEESQGDASLKIDPSSVLKQSSTIRFLVNLLEAAAGLSDELNAKDLVDGDLEDETGAKSEDGQILKEEESQTVSDLLAKAVEGLVKLMWQQVIKDPSVFPVLVSLFFSAKMQSNHLMVQCLATFFQAFAIAPQGCTWSSKPSKLPAHKSLLDLVFLQRRQLLESSFSSSIQSFIRLLSSDPSTETPPSDVASWMMDLLPPLSSLSLSTASSSSSSSEPSEETEVEQKEKTIAEQLATFPDPSQVHDRLSLALLDEIAANKTGVESKKLPKALAKLQVSLKDPALTLRLRETARLAREEIKDRSALSAFSRFFDRLSSTASAVLQQMGAAVEEEDEEVVGSKRSSPSSERPEAPPSKRRRASSSTEDDEIASHKKDSATAPKRRGRAKKATPSS